MQHTETASITDRERSFSELKLIRDRCLEGQLCLDEFRYRAAMIYLEAELPLRALGMLKKLHGSYAASATLPDVDSLIASIWKRPRSAQPLCTLTMIVRNEEANIGAALDSVDGLIDEIVICDTGSVDTTLGIASLYGAHLIETPWNNSFSEARNRAISASNGDWIFWMDADDRLDTASRARLRALWQTSGKQVAFFRIVNQRPGTFGSEFMQPRLFPRAEGVCFEGRVHEQIVFSAARQHLPMANYGNITILHNGYASEEMHRAKARRNIPLIADDLADNPGDPVLCLSLGDSYAIAGSYRQAITAYRMVIDKEDNYYRHRDVYIQAHYYLGQIHHHLGETHEAKALLLRCLYLDETRIEAAQRLGTLYAQEQDLDRAFYFFVKALQVTPPLRVTATDVRDITTKATFQLTEILLAWEKYREAEEVLEPAIRRYPLVVDFYAQMGRALLGQNRLKDAAWYFTYSRQSFPAGNPGAYLGLAALYHSLQDPRKAADFLTQAIENNSASPEVYTMLGNMLFEAHEAAGALDAFEHVLTDNELTDQEAMLWKATSCALDVCDIGRAKRYIGRILDRNPNNREAIDVFEKIAAEEKATGQPSINQGVMHVETASR
jgi:glycosyltransferase involved in cell wall biosynthesis